METNPQKDNGQAKAAEAMSVTTKPILDACCGGRQFWFDKSNKDVLFCDRRVMKDTVVGSGKDARVRRCLPDKIHDFRCMDFADCTFEMVVFDPPHLFLGENSFMAKSYGSLDKNTWREDLTKGFAECFRVLKRGGFLVFKWNECDIPLKEILKLTPNKPLFGHPSGKAQKTHWCLFRKSTSMTQKENNYADAYEAVCSALNDTKEKLKAKDEEIAGLKEDFFVLSRNSAEKEAVLQAELKAVTSQLDEAMHIIVSYERGTNDEITDEALKGLRKKMATQSKDAEAQIASEQLSVAAESKEGSK